MLTEYEENGGRLIITADYNTEETPVFDTLLGNFGLELADGIVFEEDSKKPCLIISVLYLSYNYSS